ncbi:hypothetical protein NDU88_005708 [Pleurodeles waltl]|uniref:2'-5'-oligoadenylate synthetase 1 domain-containing protein n=1 Tax=Pleurodeles waltl TaxID=8319 RepID=A0AAV7LSU3_PLEWA|nr:hypothetical protein NDU88_005708 [Pleurodeles waltl]
MELSDSTLYDAPSDRLDAWIAECLLPDEEFGRQIREATRRIVEFLKTVCFRDVPVHKVRGSLSTDVKPDPEVCVSLIKARGGPGELSPCFTELQRNFMKRRPRKLKNLIHLVKHWYKEVM